MQRKTRCQLSIWAVRLRTQTLFMLLKHNIGVDVCEIDGSVVSECREFPLSQVINFVRISSSSSLFPAKLKAFSGFKLKVSLLCANQYRNVYKSRHETKFLKKNVSSNFSLKTENIVTFLVMKESLLNITKESFQIFFLSLSLFHSQSAIKFQCRKKVIKEKSPSKSKTFLSRSIFFLS